MDEKIKRSYSSARLIKVMITNNKKIGFKKYGKERKYQ